MINLLATERKDEIRAARVNVILMRYKAIVLLAFVFTIAALFVSYTVLTSTKDSAERTIEANDIKAGVYSETKQQVDGLSAKLNETKFTLNQEIRYSEVLVSLGQLMPPGTILGEITLSTASFNGQPVEIKAYAKTTDDAGILKSAFENSPLFAQPVNIKSTESSQEVAGYPETISMSVIFNRISR